MDEVENKKDEIKAISFIYKRKKIKEDDTTISYVYELVGFKKGHEILDSMDNVCFVSDDGNTYGYIDDVFCLDDEYAYAFTIYTDTLDSYERDHKLYALQKDEKLLKEYYLFQIYTKGSVNLKTYSVDPKDPDRIISIYTSNIEDLKSVLSNEYEKVEEVKDLIKIRFKDIPLLFDTQNQFYADDIYNQVSKTVICQDSQIKSISASITKNQRITDPKLKDNLLVCGPTGVGKTEIFRCISKITGLPLIMEDSTEYTANGFKGKDVTDMLYNLYLSADKNIEKAQRGIILIDEIDKKISSRNETEIYTKAVLDSLLKMSEGHVYHIERKEGKIDIDTSFITFVVSGAFSGIDKLNEKRRTLGFISNEEKEEQNKASANYTDQTLIKYGVMPEFLGRNKLVVMNNLGEKEFCKIIQESDKSYLLLYKYLLENMGINFIYEEGTIEAIAKKAIELGAGARSIKKIIENAFEIINYQLFSRGNYNELIISPQTIDDNTKFILR
ncbi:MAG: AAA family ATPase [bacterium]|nr:AAA family ATPase [bacterium]